ncbi:PorT family protein [Pseudoflavitalea sp. X16]|uniref:outer membrane beta-barrel protein n=1 Tax=Paraflavitalea devenefica TaxID=2716334 RepID=UPI00141FE04C|nr:outer membrane beta-barrel protein [Paraflavitalea devenefica]NII24835.1 PorT family protein [Paraflavitalea devenefica]
MKTGCLFLIAFLLISLSTVQGQTNYQPGSLVLKTGEQVSGLIDYREWRQNPRKINFRKTPQDQIAQYSVEDLQAFKIDGKDSFERAIVTKDMRPVEVSEVIEHMEDDHKQIDTVFLRVLVKGTKLNLYELVDAKSHYYINADNGDFQELQYQVHFDHTASSLQHKYIFRNQLRPYTLGHIQENKLLRNLERIKYQENDLVKIVYDINGTQLAKKKKSAAQFFVAAGLAYSNIKLGGNSELNNLQYSGNIGYSAGVGMDIFSSRNLQDFILRMELFYSSLKYEGKGVLNNGSGPFNARYTIRQTNITPSIALLYNFLRKTSYKVYLSGGVQYNFSTYPENDYVKYVDENTPSVKEDYLDFEKNWLEFTARIGGMINDKIELGLLATVAGSFERFLYVNGKPAVYTFRIGYRFNNK